MGEASGLSRREREIMEVVYARGEATAGQVVEGLAKPPSQTAVRTFLRILEEKGHLAHRKVGRQFVYRPTRARPVAGRSALRRLLDVFFDGSIEKAVAAHLTDPSTAMSSAEIEGLQHLIREAKKRRAGK